MIAGRPLISTIFPAHQDQALLAETGRKGIPRRGDGEDPEVPGEPAADLRLRDREGGPPRAAVGIEKPQQEPPRLEEIPHDPHVGPAAGGGDGAEAGVLQDRIEGSPVAEGQAEQVCALETGLSTVTAGQTPGVPHGLGGEVEAHGLPTQGCQGERLMPAPATGDGHPTGRKAAGQPQEGRGRTALFPAVLPQKIALGPEIRGRDLGNIVPDGMNRRSNRSRRQGRGTCPNPLPARASGRPPRVVVHAGFPPRRETGPRAGARRPAEEGQASGSHTPPAGDGK